MLIRSLSTIEKIQQLQVTHGPNTFSAFSSAINCLAELIHQKNLTEARSAFPKLSELAKNLPQEEIHKSAQLFQQLALLLDNAGDFESSASQFLQASKMYTRQLEKYEIQAILCTVEAYNMFTKCGELNKADETLENVLPFLPKIAHPIVKAVFCEAFGRSKAHLANFELAIEYLNTAKDILSKLPSDVSISTLLSSCLITLADIYFKKNLFSKAKDCSKSALYLNLQLPTVNLPAVLEVYSKIVACCYEQKEFQEIVMLVMQAKETCMQSEIEDKQIYAEELFRSVVGDMIQKGDFGMAAIIMKKKLEFCVEIYGEGSEKAVECYEALVNFYIKENSHDEAIYYRLKALSFYQQTGDIEKIVQSFISLSELYLIISNYAEAEYYLTSCRPLLQNPQSSSLLAENYNSTAKLFKVTKENEKALYWAQQYHDLICSFNKPNYRNIILSNINLSETFLILKNLKKALDHAEQAVKIAEAEFNPNSIFVATVTETLANVYRHSGELEKSEELFLKSLRLKQLKLNKDDASFDFLYENLIKLYFEKEDLKNLIVYGKLRIEILKKIGGYACIEMILALLLEAEKKYANATSQNEMASIVLDRQGINLRKEIKVPYD